MWTPDVVTAIAELVPASVDLQHMRRVCTTWLSGTSEAVALRASAFAEDFGYTLPFKDDTATIDEATAFATGSALGLSRRLILLSLGRAVRSRSTVHLVQFYVRASSCSKDGARKRLILDELLVARPDIVRCRSSLVPLVTIGTADRGVEELDFAQCRNLADAQFTLCLGSNPTQHLTNLALSLNMDITDEALRSISRIKSLEVLGLDECRRVTDHGLAAVAAGCPTLRQLFISACTQLSNATLSNIGQHLRGLERLHVAGNNRYDANGFKKLAGLHQLAVLDASGCRGVDDAALGYIAQLPALEHLFVSLCSLVTDAGLARVAACPNLKVLKTVGVDKVSGAFLAALDAREPSPSPSASGSGGLGAADDDDEGSSVVRESKLETLNVSVCRGLGAAMLQQHLPARLPNLRHLGVACLPNVTGAALKHVSQYTKLTFLRLTQVALDAEWLGNVLPGLQHLTELDVCRCGQGTSDAALAPLASLPCLKSLDLTAGLLTDEGIRHIHGPLQDTLQKLTLSSCSAIVGRTFASVGGLRKLETLNLQDCAILKDCALDALRAGPAANSLTSLNARNCVLLTQAGMASIGGMRRLRSIQVGGCTEAVASTDTFEVLHRLSGLTSIDVALCDKLLHAHFGAIRHLRSLQTLTIAFSNMTNHAVSHICQLRTLRELRAAHCGSLDDDAIAKLSALPHLEVLDMSRCNGIAGETLDRLCGLKRLTSLNFEGCPQFCDKALQAIGQMPRLTSLNVSRCDKVTDAGLAALHALGSLQNLQCSDCKKLTDVGVIAAFAGDLPGRLDSLGLRGCERLTDACLPAIARCCVLRWLDLGGKASPLTGEGLAKHIPRLVDLTTLRVGGVCGLDDVSWLRGCPQLRMVTLPRCADAEADLLLRASAAALHPEASSWLKITWTSV